MWAFSCWKVGTGARFRAQIPLLRLDPLSRLSSLWKTQRLRAKLCLQNLLFLQQLVRWLRFCDRSHIALFRSLSRCRAVASPRTSLNWSKSKANPWTFDLKQVARIVQNFRFCWNNPPKIVASQKVLFYQRSWNQIRWGSCPAQRRPARDPDAATDCAAPLRRVSLTCRQGPLSTRDAALSTKQHCVSLWDTKPHATWEIACLSCRVIICAIFASLWNPMTDLLMWCPLRVDLMRGFVEISTDPRASAEFLCCWACRGEKSVLRLYFLIRCNLTFSVDEDNVCLCIWISGSTQFGYLWKVPLCLLVITADKRWWGTIILLAAAPDADADGLFGSSRSWVVSPIKRTLNDSSQCATNIPTSATCLGWIASECSTNSHNVAPIRVHHLRIERHSVSSDREEWVSQVVIRSDEITVIPLLMETPSEKQFCLIRRSFRKTRA